MTKNVGDSKPTYTIIPDTGLSNFFVLYCTTPVWYGYDFIDIQVLLNVAKVSSISAALGDVIIPIEYNYTSHEYFEGSSFFLTVRMDLRGIEYTSAVDPILTITGSCNWDDTSMVTLTACSGVNIVNDPHLSFFGSILDAIHDLHSNVASWFELQTVSIGKWFKDLEASFDASIQKVVDAINGDQTAGDEFGNEVAEKSEALENIGAAFDSVERPDIDKVEMSVDAYLSPVDLHNSTAGLSSAISSGPILSVLMISIIMATIGYILYGKK